MTATPTTEQATTADGPDTAPAVAQAEQHAADAEQTLAAMEERVRDGDEDVTPAQLAEARELGRFARLRAEAARRKAERATAKAAEQERARLTAKAVALVDQEADPATVATAYEQARTALAALVAAVTAHDNALHQAAHLLRQADAPPIIRYVPVQRGEHTFQEAEHAPASRTAPTVEHGNSAALSLSTGRARNTIGTGPTLATLLDETAHQHGVAMPAGETAFTAAPIGEHAHRHADRVRRFLDTATAQTPETTK
ncbi:hypothetical protein AB0I84_09410 [Streptomyces spectabilis]|uniref:hypothetical protein n=1 Tax=Streptomyces spectabilis TaxID=68270 RepID=UPI0033E59271